jgi:hypothetical protein
MTINNIETIAVYRVKGSKNILRLISGGTSLYQVLSMPSIAIAQQMTQYPIISKDKANEITGNNYHFEY